MDEHYRTARRAALEARGLVEQLESGGPHDALTKLDAALPKLEALARNLDTLIPQQEPARRTVWVAKLGQLDQEIRDIRAVADRKRRDANAASDEARMRVELMSRRNAAVAAGETAIDFSHEEEARTLNRADGAIDNIFLSGKDTLESLYMQRGRLKGTQRRMLDFANQIGISRDLIRKIERRENANLYIIAAAFAIIILFMLVLAFFFKKH